MIEEIKETEEPAIIIEDVAAMIVRHEKDIKKLNDRMSTLEGFMIMGQVMSCLERNIVTAILKGTPAERETTYITLSQIEKLLRGKMGRFLPKILMKKEEKAIAESNWESFDSKYHLDNSLYFQLERLKTNRNGPRLTTKEAEDAIKRDSRITSDERKACMQALNTLKKMEVTYIAF